MNKPVPAYGEAYGESGDPMDAPRPQGVNKRQLRPMPSNLSTVKKLPSRSPRKSSSRSRGR